MTFLSKEMSERIRIQTNEPRGSLRLPASDARGGSGAMQTNLRKSSRFQQNIKFALMKPFTENLQECSWINGWSKLGKIFYQNMKNGKT